MERIVNRIVDSASELAKILDGRTKSTGQHVALCPAHGDKNRSLSIKEGKNNKILLFCHAGCTYEEIVNALMNKGISVNHNSELSRDMGLPDGIYSTFEGKSYVCHWTYYDTKGNIIGYTVRFESATEDKVIIPYFNRDANKWKAGYTKDKHVLYNLHIISQAPEEEDIFIVEGEKCADALTKLGFIATTSPGGAAAATKADWTPLAGRHVIMWPDNDQAGRTFATNVFQMLNEISESTFSISQIDIDKLNLKPKDDVYDWILKGGSAKDILSLPRITIYSLSDMGDIVLGGKTCDVMDEAENLLMKKKPFEIFQRAGLIVRIFNPKNEKSKENSIRLLTVKTGFLTDLLNRELNFVRLKGKELIPVDPPNKLAENYMERAGFWKLHPLEGLIFAPTLREDGTILEKTGYDIDSGFYYLDSGTKFEPLIKQPTKEDALSELEELKTLLRDFPFVKPEDESVILAAIMTPLVRKNFLTAPAFGFSAPTKRSGKTLLANIVNIIATGSPVTPMGLGFNKEEQEKQIFAKLMEGRPVILIDNVEEPVKGGTFCAIMTSSSGKYNGRILGISETKDVSTIVTFLVTGNNLSFEGDMTGRVLMCTIDPKREHPENRSDIKVKNLPRYVMTNRAKYVKAALTILRAYIIAGKPPQDIPPWGGFEEWSALVRSALVWLGGADPYLTQKVIEEADPQNRNLKSALNLWRKIYEDRSLKVSEIGNDCNSSELGTDTYELGQILLEVTGSRGKLLDNKAVGKWLSRNKNRVIDGKMFIISPLSAKNINSWIVKDA